MESIQKLALSDFPPLLREIPDPPRQLYRRGTLPPARSVTLCVVGSRKYSAYGERVVKELVRGLAGAPVVVVSGLALGIDALAHQAALEAGVPTVAVPGSGLDSRVLAPRSNLGLAERILASGGALLSEFPPRFQAAPWAFPQRNRIMAGLAQAVLVVEASDRSGTLITARLAGEYGREVAAVPGSIFSDYSRGANQLIRDGAAAITDSGALRQLLGLGEEQTARRDPADTSDLTLEEKQILSVLDRPRTRDELIRESGLSPSRANMTITSLEMKRRLAETGGMVVRL